MNVLEGVYRDGAVEALGVRWPVAARAAEGRAVKYGIRPEHLLAGLDGAVTATVTAVEWLGHECLVFAKVGEHPVIVREQGLSPSKPGDVIKLSAEPRQVHLFDPDATNRLA